MVPKAKEGWVGVEEVAAHLRVAEASIYRWVESKAFPAHRVGRLLRFKLSEVDEWVKASGGDESAVGPFGKASRRGANSPERKSRRKHERGT